MIRYLLFVVFAIPFACGAQEPLTADISLPKDGRWRIGLTGSLDYASRVLQDRGDVAIAGRIIDRRNSDERGKLSYSGGVDITYRICPNFRVEGGLHYANRGYRTKQQELKFDPWGPGPYTASSYQVFRYEYLEMPLSVSYRVLDRRRVSVYGRAGVTPGVLLAGNVKSHTKFDDGEWGVTTHKGEEKRSFNVSPHAGFEVDYRLGEQSLIRVAPTFQFGLLPVVDAPIREYVWSFGVSVGYFVGL